VALRGQYSGRQGRLPHRSHAAATRLRAVDGVARNRMSAGGVESPMSNRLHLPTVLLSGFANFRDKIEKMKIRDLRAEKLCT